MRATTVNTACDRIRAVPPPIPQEYNTSQDLAEGQKRGDKKKKKKALRPRTDLPHPVFQEETGLGGECERYGFFIYSCFYHLCSSLSSCYLRNIESIYLQSKFGLLLIISFCISKKPFFFFCEKSNSSTVSSRVVGTYSENHFPDLQLELILFQKWVWD